MADGMRPRASPGGVSIGPAAVATLLLAVPAVLGAIWLLRMTPPTNGCGAAAEPELVAQREEWLRGAKLAFGVGTLLVLAAILRTSAWRRRDRRPGPVTIAVCCLFALYLAACLAYRDLFRIFAGVLVLTAAGWPVTVPLAIVGTTVWYRRQARRARPLAALAAMGWCSLLLGVGSIATLVALAVTEPLLC